MGVGEWFLSAAERGNPHTRIDDVHPGDRAWSDGNEVRPLIDGAAYFAELAARIAELAAGDLLLFVDWRGDPDERLTGAPGSEVSRVLAGAARRGVDVRGLIWRSHLDRLAFSAAGNRHLGREIEDAGGECLLDMRVRAGGSQHQKFVVLRHRDRPERDVAFVGGIDLCHGRRDDADHGGDPQPLPITAAYGGRPPWHDVQLAISGPAVYDVETVFRERWEDPAALSRNPFHWVEDTARGINRTAGPLPEQGPPPPRAPGGSHSVQLLRTCPYRWPGRIRGHPFAPAGERSVASGYAKAILRARRLIYVEDQYLWSAEVAAVFARALRANPDLLLIAVLPHHPDQEGPFSLPASIIGRQEAVALLTEAGGDRVTIYGVENHAGTPVYVHAKVCIVDDDWAAVGSNNLNRRSWTHDSELAAAVWDGTSAASAAADPAPWRPSFARALRESLAREHLDLPDGPGTADAAGPAGPAALFAAFAESAAALQVWRDGGGVGDRPPGRLRPLATSADPPRRRWRATVLYRFVFDPDGRPWQLRRRRLGDPADADPADGDPSDADPPADGIRTGLAVRAQGADVP